MARLVAVVVVGAALTTLVAGAVIWFRLDRQPMQLEGSSEGGTTFLLIGSDRRVELPGANRAAFGTADEVPDARADVVVVVRAQDDGSVRMLAIPRDLVVFRPDRGPARVTLLLEDGADAVAEALCHSVGIGVDHVAVVEYDGIASLVDSADGIEVHADEPIRDPMSGLELDAGSTRLDGLGALAYVRARSIETREGETWVPDPTRSEQRSERTFEVLEQLAEQLDASWTSPVSTFRHAWAATGAVTVGGNTSPFDLMAMRRAVGTAGSKDMYTFPVVERPAPIPVADPGPDAASVVTEFLGDDEVSTCDTPVLMAPPP